MFELAFQLRRPVGDILAMTYDEFQGWLAYLERRPVGWREDDRTYKLLRAWGTEAKPEEIFPSLAALSASAPAGDEPPTIKGSAFLERVLKSKGGERLS